MKKNLLFFVIAIPFLFTGCVSTPRLNGPPVVVGSTNYTVAQAPVQLDVANKGPQWNQFVRGYNAERLGHNLRIAEIENRGAEQARAKEGGVEYTPLALGQMYQPATPAIQSSVPLIPMTVPVYITTPTFNFTTIPAFGSGSFYYGSGVVVGGGSFWSGMASGNVGRTPRWQSTPGYRHFWGGWRR